MDTVTPPRGSGLELPSAVATSLRHGRGAQVQQLPLHLASFLFRHPSTSFIPISRPSNDKGTNTYSPTFNHDIQAKAKQLLDPLSCRELPPATVVAVSRQETPELVKVTEGLLLNRAMVHPKATVLLKVMALLKAMEIPAQDNDSPLPLRAEVGTSLAVDAQFSFALKR